MTAGDAISADIGTRRTNTAEPAPRSGTALPHLLWIGHFFPFPVNTGGALRSFHMIRELSSAFRVTVLSYFRANHHEDRAAIEAAAREFSKVLGESGVRVLTPRPFVATDRSRVRWLLAHIRSAATRRPVGFTQLGDREFRHAVNDLIDGGDVGLIHIDSIDLYEHVRRVSDRVPVICNFHDVDSAALYRRAAGTRSGLIASYVRAQAGAYARLQKEAGRHIALNLVCSDTEAEHLRATAPEARIAVVENGVDTESLRPLDPTRSEPERIVFVGPQFFHPNRQGVEWFLTRCWPRIRAARPGARFTVVGKIGEEQQAALNAMPGVEATGLVDDVREFLARAACVVVPLRTGGGTRLKILEAWSVERPVVSTSIGCEGLAAVDGANLLVCDDADAFADAVLRVLDQPGLGRRLATAGRRTVEDHYGWTAIGGKMRCLYEEARTGARA